MFSDLEKGFRKLIERFFEEPNWFFVASQSKLIFGNFIFCNFL